MTTRRTVIYLAAVVLASPVLTGLAGAQHLLHGASGLPHGVPDLCANPTISTVTSGSWSNPSTWSSGRVPTTGDRVRVGTGVTVAYDRAADDSLVCVGVAGTLSFRTDVNTRMKVATLLVYESGALEIGTASQMVQPGVKAEVIIANRPIDLVEDPEQFGTGVIGLGRVTIHGAVRSPTFARLATEPAAGATTLTATDVLSGWRASDTLIVPDSHQLSWTETTPGGYIPQNEEVTAAAAAGTGITLTAPLQFLHPGARNGDGVLEFLPHVANLTRNVVIRSEDPTGTRGHVILVRTADVDIRYARFEDLGRTTLALLDSTTFDANGNVVHVGTNQIGRYPIHLHHVSGRTETSKQYQFTLVGNAVVRAPKWAIAVHNSHYGLVQQNVLYDIGGAAFMAEDGSESFNTVERNMAIKMRGTGGRQGEGREATGFYFRGPNNYVRGNVAVNALSDQPDSGYGFKFFFEYLENIRVPLFPGADTSQAGQYVIRDGNATPLLEFSGNEVYGATESGATYWWLGAYNNHPRATEESVIRDLRIWHVYNKGIFNYPSSRVHLDGLVMRGVPRLEAWAGFVGGDYLADNLQITRADIQGITNGIIPSTDGGTAPQVIHDSYLRNFTNVRMETLQISAYRADILPPRSVIVSDVTFAKPADTSQRPYRSIEFIYATSPTRNLVQRDEIRVYNYNKTEGDDFRGYYLQQAPNFVVPQTIFNSDSTPSVAGSPTSGLTNQQNWAAFSIAIAGSIAPCATTRPDVDGFVCGVAEAFTPPQSGPRAPANVRLLSQ